MPFEPVNLPLKSASSLVLLLRLGWRRWRLFVAFGLSFLAFAFTLS